MTIPAYTDIDVLDSHTVSITYSDDSALPAWFTLDAGPTTLTFAPTSNTADLGLHTLKFKVTDDN